MVEINIYNHMNKLIQSTKTTIDYSINIRRTIKDSISCHPICLSSKDIFSDAVFPYKINELKEVEINLV